MDLAYAKHTYGPSDNYDMQKQVNLENPQLLQKVIISLKYLVPARGPYNKKLTLSPLLPMVILSFLPLGKLGHSPSNNYFWHSKTITYSY